jgi:hypothetical protein
VFGEMKSAGYDAKCVRQIIRLRKMKPDDRREMEAILEVYKNALGSTDAASPCPHQVSPVDIRRDRAVAGMAEVRVTIRLDGSLEVTVRRNALDDLPGEELD